MKTPLLVEKHIINSNFSTKMPVFVDKCFKADGFSTKMLFPVEKMMRDAVGHAGYQQGKALKNRIFVDK